MQEYIAVFEPLVLEECGALLVRGNEEALNMQAHQAVVAITSLQDEFLVSRIAMDEGVARDYSDNDFILLSKDDPNVSVFKSLFLHSVLAAVSTTVI
ncbi:TPA: hypothetical protein ACH3X2_011048, partial [Trebouxia sp. C0005]